MIKKLLTKAKKNLTCKNIFFISIGCCVVALSTQVYVSNRLAVKGKQLLELAAERDRLEKQISELRLEQSKYSSLSYLEQKAQGMGFIENPSFVLSVSNVTPTARATSL